MTRYRRASLGLSMLAVAALLLGGVRDKRSVVSDWKLQRTPHGIVHWRSSHPVNYTVHQLDADGGHVRARYFVEDRPHCFADIRYKWKFSESLTRIHQGQRFQVLASVVPGESHLCGDLSHADDPTIRVTGGNGVGSTGSVYLDDASFWSRYLIWGATAEIHAYARDTKPTTFVVRDSTKGGIDMNSDDGYLKISLNSSYEVIYKFVSGR